MDRQSRLLAIIAKRHLILASLVAVSVAGCASDRGARIASKQNLGGADTLSNGNRWSVAEETSWRQLVDHSEPAKVQAAGYNAEDLNSPPVAVADMPHREAEQSLAGFLGIDPMRPESESDVAGASTTLPSDATSTVDSTTVSGQSVDYFVRAALAGHPKLSAARQRVSAAIQVIPQSKALPDPTFNNTFWPIHDQALQTAAGRMGNQMSVNQMVPFPDKLRAKAVIASREVQIAHAEVDVIAREITESVRLAYYEVWFANRAIEIIADTKVLVDDLTKVAEARYRSGGSQQDVLRAQLETDRLDDQLTTLRKQKQIAEADLATLMQQPVDLIPEVSNDLGVTDAPEQLESLIALAEQCNPRLRGLAWEIQRDRDKQRLACLQQYPDLNFGVNWGLVSDDHDVISPVANGHDNLSFTVGTTLPIWRDKINAGIREAAHRTGSTTRRLQAERDELYGKLRRLIAQADALNEQRDIYENRIIPRTEDTLKLSIADYRGKRADFFSLIETYRELLMFETQLARIDATLAGTIAQIDRTVGCPF